MSGDWVRLKRGPYRGDLAQAQPKRSAEAAVQTTLDRPVSHRLYRLYRLYPVLHMMWTPIGHPLNDPGLSAAMALGRPGSAQGELMDMKRGVGCPKSPNWWRLGTLAFCPICSAPGRHTAWWFSGVVPPIRSLSLRARWRRSMTTLTP